VLSELIGPTLATVMMIVNGDAQCVATRIPFCANMNVVANATRVLSAIFIVTIDVGMVRCSAHAVSVILSEIKLRAATGWTRIAIVPNLAREGNVEIVVDTTMGPRQLHVEIHETTCKVERSF